MEDTLNNFFLNHYPYLIPELFPLDPKLHQTILRSFRHKICYFSGGLLVCISNRFKTFFIILMKVSFPSLTCNLKSFTWVFNDAKSFILSKSSVFQLNTTFIKLKLIVYVFISRRVRLESTFNVIYFAFIRNTKIPPIFHFSFIDVKIVIFNLPRFPTWLFEFLIWHITSCRFWVEILYIF